MDAETVANRSQRSLSLACDGGLLELQKLGTLGLLEMFASSLDELKRRGVTRSTNNPVADYAEGLCRKALGLKLAAKSTKGHDATDRLGRRYEIKSRRLTAHNASRQLSPMRALDEQHFDFLVGVLFGSDFAVMKACMIPYAQVKGMSKYVQHTNGWILHLRDSVWTAPEVVDVTQALCDAQRSFDD